MIFYKTSSFGNDFIEIDESDLPAQTADKCLLAREICDAHRAVGADGVVFYSSCRKADIPLGDSPCCKAGIPSGDRPCCKAGIPLGDRGLEFNFQIHNRDGGEAELSGNGMAGLAAVLFQRRLASSPLLLQTRSGPRHVALLGRDGPVFQLEVEIGRADFSNREFFPFLKGKQECYAGVGLEFFPVSVGNPHAVILCRDWTDSKRLAALGKKLENHPMFPGRVNVEFVYFSAAEHPPEGTGALRHPSPTKGTGALRHPSPTKGTGALRHPSPLDGTAALRPASPTKGTGALRHPSCRVFFYERGVGPTLASSTGSAAVFAVLRRLGLVKDRLLIDCGADKIAVTWKQGIFIHNFTRLVCRGNYF